jgi:hypothetical protein
MSITSSIVTIEGAQRDGRRWVREVHSDGQGVAAIIDYLGASNAGATAQTTANARATNLNESLADAEFEAKRLIDATPLPLRWQTGAQLLARIREAYRRFSQVELARLARWVLNRILDGTVTDQQLQNAFGLTAPQWTALKARMQIIADDQTVIDAAVGE